MITTDRTGLQRQAAAAALINELIHSAIGFGARTAPTFRVNENGEISVNLHYDSQPTMADLSAWNLTLGPYEVESVSYNAGDGWRVADVAYVTVSEAEVRFAVSYPYTPVGLEDLR